MSNLFWGMQFRTCVKFWESADSSPALSQNFTQIQKPHRHYFDCLLHNFVILSRRRRISKRNLIRFCESQNLGENSEKNAESRLDSANQNNPSLRDSAKRAESWQSTNESKNSPSLAEGARGWVKNPFITRLCRFAESSHICHSKSFSCHSERSEESKKIRHCEILRETRRIVARVAQATRPHLQIHIKK